MRSGPHTAEWRSSCIRTATAGTGASFKRITEAYNHLKGGGRTPDAKTDNSADVHDDAMAKNGRRGSNAETRIPVPAS